MNRIRLLPDHVANQIAAGEVVERPASVVKELVENALDAQAARITVEIQAGGRSLIRVTDDGFGMSRDDALLCLERHATSKIQRASDLSSIATMGFRGEALPSIASVSRFTLTTRERESESPEGSRIVVAAGRINEVKAAGSAPGTCVEVRQLFFNLPARRKFLRTEETEAAHVQHYLTLAALAFPEVAFTFIKDGHVVWQLAAQTPGPAARGPASDTDREPLQRLAGLQERLRALMGDTRLLAVDFRASLAQDATPDPASGFESGEAARPASDPGAATFYLWGLIGAPGVSRGTREDQHLFVNRRPVENRGLNFALLEGYHTALMKGRYPVCSLFLEMDPAAVDVNIHPSKREVKFHREAEVRRLVARAVRETLLAFHSAAPSTGRESGGGRGPARGEVMGKPIEIRPAPLFSTPPLPQQPAQGAPIFAAPSPAAGGTAANTGFTPPRPEPSDAVLPAIPASPPPAIRTPTPNPAPMPAAAPVPLLSVPLRLVGVIGKLYVVLESDRGLVLLDQHAAHERILFEQMLNRLEQKQSADSQKLLLPETVELAARDAQFLRDQLGVLTRLGVGLSEFGERTFLLDALPPFVKAGDPRRFVLQLVDELKAAGQEVNSLRLGEHVVAKTVCRHAVKANDPLRGRELETLVEELRRCAMPYTCPHGRPTLIEMHYRELEKKFGRAQ